MIHHDSSVMQLFCFRVLVEKLSAVFTLLEAFGNSRTLMNTTATRFTQLFTLDFDTTGQIAAASVQVEVVDGRGGGGCSLGHSSLILD